MHAVRSRVGSDAPSILGKVQEEDEEQQLRQAPHLRNHPEEEKLVTKASGSAPAAPSTGGTFPQRYWVVFVTFLATFIMYLDRSGFPLVYTRVARGLRFGESTKGAVMSAFYYGYAALQIPGGILAARLGGRWVLAVAFLGWGGLIFLVPHFWQSVTALMLLRATIGALQGVCIPAFHTVLASWVPPHERSTAFSLPISGLYLGSAGAVAFLPGYMTRYGPEQVYKGVAILALVWLGLWLSIRTEPRSSERVTVSMKEGSRSPNIGRELLRSAAVWAIIINSFTFHYTLYMIVNWLPTYFEKYIRVEMTNLGNLKVIPFLLMFFFANAGGLAGDWLLRCDRRVAVVRKVINTAGFTVACLAQLGMCAARREETATVAIACTLSGLGFARGGFSVNHVDIAPEHAGLVIGMSNCAGTVAGIVGVHCTGTILDMYGGAEHLNGWLVATLVSSALNLAGAAFFVAFARGTAMF